jgi:hypothetical protein
MQKLLATERQRPLGVTIISVILGIEGLFEVILGILTLIATFAARRAIIVHGHTVIAGIVSALGLGLGFGSLVIGLITLFFTWGLWTLRSWAFWATVIIAIFALLVQIARFLQPVYAVGPIVGGMILPVVILLYFLVNPHVRHAFRV